MTETPLYSGPIVDAHQHFWDPGANHHPWLSGAETIPFRYGDYSAIKRRYLPGDYRRDAAGHDVVESVYVETEWDPNDPIGETRYASGLAEKYGLPNAIVAQAWLDRADAADVLAAQAGFGAFSSEVGTGSREENATNQETSALSRKGSRLVRSVRHKPGGPESPAEVGSRRSLMSDERWRRGYAELGRHGLHFDLQTPWWNFGEAIALARDFPSTTIILNHTGLPSDRSQDGLRDWHIAMSRLAERPNVRVKISGIGLKGRPWRVEDNAWIVRETIAIFGVDRAMFASNFPVDSLCASFDTIFTGFKTIVAHLPPREQRQLFCDNARALYRTQAG